MGDIVRGLVTFTRHLRHHLASPEGGIVPSGAGIDDLIEDRIEVGAGLKARALQVRLCLPVHVRPMRAR